MVEHHHLGSPQVLLHGELGQSPEAWTIKASDGTDFAFHSVDELRQFIEQESGMWNWVRVSGSGQLRAAMQGPLSGFKTAIGLLNNSDKPYDMKSDSAVQSVIEQYLAFSPALHGRAPLQAFVSGLAEKDPHQAAAALGWLLKSEGVLKVFEQESIPQLSWVAGIAQAILWHRGYEPERDAEAALQRMERATREADSFRDRAAGLASAIGQVAERMSEAEGATQKSHADLISGLKKESGELMEHLRGEWDRLTKTYDDKLALSAPSKYWQSKADTHRDRATAFGWAAGLVALVGAGALWGLLKAIFSELQVNQLPSWGQVLPSTVAVVIYLWALKTLIRLTMSHIHLSLDAAERRVMIMSYLALSRRREVTAEERTALFAAIFRPSGDGIVKDETPPFPMLEFLRGGKQ